MGVLESLIHQGQSEGQPPVWSLQQLAPGIPNATQTMANLKKILRSIQMHSTMCGSNFHLRRNYPVCRLKTVGAEVRSLDRDFFMCFSQYLAFNTCKDKIRDGPADLIQVSILLTSS